MKKVIEKPVFVIVICLSSVFASAQSNLQKQTTVRSDKSTTNILSIVRGGLGNALDEYMKRLEAFGFSGALLVAKVTRFILPKDMAWPTASGQFRLVLKRDFMAHR